MYCLKVLGFRWNPLHEPVNSSVLISPPLARLIYRREIWWLQGTQPGLWLWLTSSQLLHGCYCLWDPKITVLNLCSILCLFVQLWSLCFFFIQFGLIYVACLMSQCLCCSLVILLLSWSVFLSLCFYSLCFLRTSQCFSFLYLLSVIALALPTLTCSSYVSTWCFFYALLVCVMTPSLGNHGVTT